MTYPESGASRIPEIIESIKDVCSGFYGRHKSFLYSIVLTGSLARGDARPEKREIFDADIVVVSRGVYNPLLCVLLKRNLEKRVKNVEFDVGLSYPVSRLKKETSLLMYDIKNSGMVLAGQDVKKVIPDIFPRDLYPIESIRLLMNASCHIVFSLGADEKQLSNEIDKAMRWCLDAFLLFNRRFAPSFRERKKIVQIDYPEFFRALNEVTGCKDLMVKYGKGRLQLLETMNVICQDLGLKDVTELVNYLEKKYTYPVLFRAYSLLISKQFRSIFGNLIFDIYRFTVSFIKNFKVPVRPSKDSIEFFNEIWEKLPQPVG